MPQIQKTLTLSKEEIVDMIKRKYGDLDIDDVKLSHYGARCLLK